MNKAVICAILFSALCFQSAALAADMSEWSHFAPLEVYGSNKYKAVFLTDEVYAQALPNLSDLRLIDSANQQVPYYIQAGNILLEQKATWIATRPVLSFRKDEDSYFDYAAVIQPGIDPMANKLAFALMPGRNFVKQVEVYGSYDNVKWEYVNNGQIYRVDGRVQSELLFGGIRKFSYYRVRILENSGDFSPGEMKLVYAENRADLTRYERSFVPEYEVKNAQRETIITVKNPKKLHIKRVVFDVEGNFQRNYSVYAEVKAVSLLQSGEMYNLQFAGVNIANKGIALNKQLSAEAFAIKVYDRDDRPLQIKEIRVEYFVDKLVFPDLGDGPYRLYFGNSKAEKPVYELALQRNFVEKEAQDNCAIQPSQDNKQAATIWPKIQDKYLVNGAITFASLVLILILVRTVNKRNL